MNLPLAGDATPRERILSTAHDLFYREGIRATGIDRVIAEAGVTKVTFYRQFPSKDDLILAFLEQRHERWMTWFVDALARHGGTVDAIVPTLREWFSSPDYRGCAFINSVGELGPVQPAVVEVTRSHKQEMADAVAAVLPTGRGRSAEARAIALAIDGAIVQAQVLGTPEEALEPLSLLLKAMKRGA
ncbi:TetR/AcrR family transcriptional regulator [Piscinibacter terrae]|uniref:TetR/AcrR family transcriptional regulator n=1 Tax=Piscinibacter terrae TaxID=2496871 RepID=UPI001F34156F|nr:TetR/AcrR family transcriptional regulator [Albitalea terrae]